MTRLNSATEASALGDHRAEASVHTARLASAAATQRPATPSRSTRARPKSAMRRIAHQMTTPAVACVLSEYAPLSYASTNSATASTDATPDDEATPEQSVRAPSSVASVSSGVDGRSPPPPAVRCALVVLAAASASAALAASAQAGGPAQPVSSAIAQYVEMIPTGEGVQAAGVGAPRTTKLPPKVARQIREHAGADAATLEQVATSSAYGAPTTAVSWRHGRPSGGRSSEGSERRRGADRAGGSPGAAHVVRSRARGRGCRAGVRGIRERLARARHRDRRGVRRRPPGEREPEVGERGGGPEHR